VTGGPAGETGIPDGETTFCRGFEGAEKSDVRSGVRPVMPTQVGIHDLRLLHAAKA
jgi:hypothetical protein